MIYSTLSRDILYLKTHTIFILNNIFDVYDFNNIQKKSLKRQYIHLYSLIKNLILRHFKISNLLRRNFFNHCHE